MPDTPILDAQALRSARQRAGLTQHELARRVGVVGGDRVSKWEVGGVTPRLEFLLRLADVLGVALSDLVASGEGGGDVDLRLLRVRTGQAPRLVAASLNVSRRTLSRWESGDFKRMPSRATLSSAARLLGVAADEVERALRSSQANVRRAPHTALVETGVNMASQD